MSTQFDDITLALAGVVQACLLVEQVAKTGYVQQEAYQVSINSLLDLNPPTALDVYGGNPQNLRLGLEGLCEMLKGTPKQTDSLKYVMGALHLQKKLSGRSDMQNVIGSRISQAQSQSEHFGATHENVIGNLASIYSDTISTFKFRIQVMGDYNYLQQSRIADQIRALLLAAIRSGTLWRQMGGNRWHLLFQRKKIVAAAEALLHTQTH